MLPASDLTGRAREPDGSERCNSYRGLAWFGESTQGGSLSSLDGGGTLMEVKSKGLAQHTADDNGACLPNGSWCDMAGTAFARRA